MKYIYNINKFCIVKHKAKPNIEATIINKLKYTEKQLFDNYKKCNFDRNKKCK
jgi:hypothetical protein